VAKIALRGPSGPLFLSTGPIGRPGRGACSGPRMRVSASASWIYRAEEAANDAPRQRGCRGRVGCGLRCHSRQFRATNPYVNVDASAGSKPYERTRSEHCKLLPGNRRCCGYGFVQQSMPISASGVGCVNVTRGGSTSLIPHRNLLHNPCAASGYSCEDLESSAARKSRQYPCSYRHRKFQPFLSCAVHQAGN
jgi:hypothetical protein